MLKVLYSLGITIIILLFMCLINVRAQEQTNKVSANDKSTQSGVITKPQEQTNKDSQGSSNHQYFWQNNSKFSFTNLFLVIFTGTLAIVAIWQYQVSKKTRRAFVSLKDIDLMEIRGRGYTSMPSNDQTTWLFFLRLANSGDTPTRNLTVSMGCKITSQGLPENFDYSYINKELSNDNGLPYVIPIQKDIKMMIGPKAEILSGPLKIATLERVISMIIEGTMDIYIWGHAEYNDIFDRTPKHRTRFCVKLFFTNQIGQVGRQKPLMSVAYYGKYNCADEDCNKKS